MRSVLVYAGPMYLCIEGEEVLREAPRILRPGGVLVVEGADPSNAM